MQTKTHAGQKALCTRQYIVFIARDEPQGHQLRDITGAEMAMRDPPHGLNIPQAAWPAFDVGLEVVIDVIKTPMARRLFLQLGAIKLCAGPQLVGSGGLAHGLAQPIVSAQGARLHQTGDDGDVDASDVGALRNGADAVADVETAVPQPHDELLDGLLHRRLRPGLLINEHQQIDVGVGR